MRVGFKILVPQLVLLALLIGAIAFLFVDLRRQEQTLRSTRQQLQAASRFADHLNSLQSTAAQSVLSYRVDRRNRRLEAIAQAEEDMGRTINTYSHAITDDRERSLLAAVVETRKRVLASRGDLLRTIDAGVENQIQAAFDRWQIHRNLLNANVDDLAAFNLNRFSESVEKIEQERLGVVRNALYGVAVGIFMVVAGFFYVRRIMSTPLAHLARSIEEFGRGRLDSRLDQVTELRADEIGRLAAAFNRMAGHIEELNRTLERRVEERTKELRESREQFRAVTETATDAIVSADGNGKITYFNEAASRTFGYPAGEAVGQSLTLLMPERFHDAHQGGIARYLSTGEARVVGRTMALTGRRKDRSEFPMELSLASWRSGDMTYFSGIIRDVTERQHFEQRLEEANRLKSEFLANMSHELRTPLNGIIGFSEMLFDEKPGKLNAKQKDYLNDIQNSGRHLLLLVNDVLDLSKVEAGKMELHPATFALPKAVEEVCAAVSPIAEKKRVVVRRNIAASIARVTLDRQKFMQVLFNLLSNAVKFTNDGGRVEVIAAPHEPGGLKLQVQDTGIGINPGDLDKLFIEFQQLDSGLARRHQGTGLGLALTKKIVEFQKGTIAVESEPGKGSTFTVILPLGAEEVTETST